MLTAPLTVSAALLLGALATGELERLARVQARMDEAFLYSLSTRSSGSVTRRAGEQACCCPSARCLLLSQPLSLLPTDTHRRQTSPIPFLVIPLRALLTEARA
jgi:hypothetical protein